MTAQIVSGVVIGVAMAVASAFVSHLLTRSRERERWEREDRIVWQKETREHEWQLGHRDDRLELYRRFLAELSQIQPRPEPRPGEPDYEAWNKAALARNEAQLIGSKAVREAATDLLEARVNYTWHRERVMSGELQEDDPEVGEEGVKLLGDAGAARQWFVDAARKDLGMDFASPNRTGGRDPEER